MFKNNHNTLGQLIGQGRTAKIYEYGQDKVVKLFYKNFEDNIDSEFKYSQLIMDNGISTPRVYNTIQIGQQKGIVYEKVLGVDLGKAISKYPSKTSELATKAAAVHAKINSIYIDGLPDQYDMFNSSISKAKELSKENKKKIIKYCATLPNTKKLCHGDLHVKNYIYCNDNLFAIDWISAYSGHPASDLARVMLLMNSPTITKPLPFAKMQIVKLMLKKYNKTFYNTYINVMKFDISLVDKFILPIATMRLNENVKYEKEWLLDIISNKLQDLDSNL